MLLMCTLWERLASCHGVSILFPMCIWKGLWAVVMWLCIASTFQNLGTVQKGLDGVIGGKFACQIIQHHTVMMQMGLVLYSVQECRGTRSSKGHFGSCLQHFFILTPHQFLPHHFFLRKLLLSMGQLWNSWWHIPAKIKLGYPSLSCYNTAWVLIYTANGNFRTFEVEDTKALLVTFYMKRLCDLTPEGPLEY